MKTRIFIAAAMLAIFPLTGCSNATPEDKALASMKAEVITLSEGEGHPLEDIAGIRCHTPETFEEDSFTGDEVEDLNTTESFTLNADCLVKTMEPELFLGFNCDITFKDAKQPAGDLATSCTSFSSRLGTELLGVKFDGDTFYRNSPNQVYPD